jgi:hypothetical protein
MIWFVYGYKIDLSGREIIVLCVLLVGY